jgi:putative MATE family efflux protein
MERDTETIPIAQRRLTDHTEGSIIGSILRMSLPSMVGFASGNIYDIADMFWLARLGAEQVAAVTIFMTFYWVIGATNQIAGTGSVALISRRYGEKDSPRAAAVIKETFILKWALAIFFGLLAYPFLDRILVVLGAEPEVASLGVRYGRVQFLGLGFYFCAYSIYTALRSVADPNKAMFIMVGGAALNMILDPFLIFGWWIFPELGLVGAAVASVISYGIVFFVGLYVFFGGKTNVRLKLKGEVGIRLQSILHMFRIGIPSGISSISWSLSRVAIMPIIAVFGTSVVAAYGMGMRISALGIMIIVGLGLGVSSLIGHNLGAEKLERAKETARQSILLSMGIMSFFSLVNLVFAPQIVWFFFKTPEMISLGSTILRITAVCFPFIGLFIAMEEIYTGAGENKPAMAFSLIHSWVLEIPMALVLTRVLYVNQVGVWWAISVASILSSLLFYLWFRRGGWMRKSV